MSLVKDLARQRCEKDTGRGITSEHPDHRYDWQPGLCLICTPARAETFR